MHTMLIRSVTAAGQTDGLIAFAAAALRCGAASKRRACAWLEALTTARVLVLIAPITYTRKFQLHIHIRNTQANRHQAKCTQRCKHTLPP